MTKIKSGLSTDQHTFEFNLKGVTVDELEVYCTYAKLSLAKLYIDEKETCFVPGHYFLGLFRYLVSEISAKDSLFPFSELKSWNMSVNGTFENRILIDQDLIVKMQIRSKENNRHWFWVEFVREKDNEVVLAGIFGFIGQHV